MTQVFLGLGSNIDPETNLRDAAAMLREQFPSLRFSPVYRSKAIGYEDQADFLNAVAVMETKKTPEEIQEVLRGTEKHLKKATPFANGPRTIDLDLLLYGDEIIDRPGLTVPHPRMHGRRFVLQPLFDLGIAGDHPKAQETWSSLLKTVENQEIAPTDLRL
jgi:2-amino-4-hydroxy-6-hydroxymethyldihydropteridine diphosphokinase